MSRNRDALVGAAILSISTCTAHKPKSILYEIHNRLENTKRINEQRVP